MRREEFVEHLEKIAQHYLQASTDAALSKALGFYFLQKYVEPEMDDVDIWNSNVDASNDRGFDFVCINDNPEGGKKVYIVQCKYSSDGTTLIPEDEVAKTILNLRDFPNIGGNVNSKLERIINEYKLLKIDDESEIEIVGIYLNLGGISENALQKLEDNGFEIFDFDRINNEVILDRALPDFSVTFKEPPLFYDNKTFIAAISVKALLNDSNITSLIRSKKIFDYNIRGQMKNRKNSIAFDIQQTAKTCPEKLFIRNNGLTIVCREFSTEDRFIFMLNEASIINGQQTVNALYSIWGELDEIKKNSLFLVAKVIDAENVEEIIRVAKASNKQNAIKESDLYANEPEQDIIANNSLLLPTPLRFTYISKRTIDLPQTPYIKREDATLLSNIFFNQNPSDRIEGIYKSGYSDVFHNLKAEHISIITKIKNVIEEKHKHQDNNNPNDKIWSDRYYVKFKKKKTINFCLYIFSMILFHRFGYDSKHKLKELLDRIYNKMLDSQNFDIKAYFNNAFWVSYQVTTNKIIKPYYEDINSSSDTLRKGIEIAKLLSVYDDFVTEKNIEESFQPKIETLN